MAITLWRLATNVEYRTLSGLFGVGISTVGTIVNETCIVIATRLTKKYVRIPQGEMMRKNVDGFETCWGFPQAAGAIDGSHISIIRPKESASDYYNRKGYYLIVLQGLVDFKGIFMDVNIGWPGKVHDARVFANSIVYTKGNNGTLLPDWKRNLSGVDVPLVILGDPAYPALPWLMKPYQETENTPADKKLFNYRQSRARMVVENAFGRLKGRWRCLLKRIDCDLSNVPNIVATCVVLHNVCEKYGDNCLEERRQHDEYQQHPITSHTGHSSANEEANTVRDAIKDYITSTTQ